MPADDPKTPPATTDAKKPDAAKTAFKDGEVLGHANGEPVIAGKHVDLNGKAIEAKAAEETLDEHHEKLTKRHMVTLVLEKRTVRGKVFPERRETVPIPSIRCVVAHRVLHGMSPDEVKALKAEFNKAHPLKDGEPDDEKRSMHFDKWALRHIDKALEGVPDVVALEKHKTLHVTDAKIAVHRKAALDALAAS